MAVLVTLFAFTGLRGIDTGRHPDEAWVLRSVVNAVETGRLLPDNYAHPSVDFTLALLAAAPEFARLLWERRGQDPGDRTFIGEVREGLRTRVGTHAFKLRTRAVFLFVTALAIVWTYLLVLWWRRSAVEALIAAALVASSWEIAYHARWIRPDTVMMQFAALAWLCVVRARSATHPIRWLCAAAIAGGLATGTKYPGAILIVPVLLAVWRYAPEPAAFRGRALCLGAVFCVTYLLSTPGTFVEPLRFGGNVVSEGRHYLAGDEVLGVQPGLPHLGLATVYLTAVAPSPYWVVSLGVTALALIGVAAAFATDRWTTGLLLIAPVLYVAYFAMQRALFVRNLLFVIPIIAVFGAIGWGALTSRLSARLRILAGVPIVILVLVNLQWLVRAAESIRNFTPERERRAALDYIRAQPGTRFLLSSGVKDALDAAGAAIEPPRPDGRVVALVYASDLVVAPRLEGNRRGRFHFLPTGPFDRNYDYFPSRVVPDRMVLVDAGDAQRMGVSLAPSGGRPVE
ncbi:MAG: glycosyltransferase family 39 protein [Candidatus Rokubacteria bacterium]|nr:glycosyltransferase family 39 protein [Candidatus Rokubacteria bacterium]